MKALDGQQVPTFLSLQETFLFKKLVIHKHPHTQAHDYNVVSITSEHKHMHNTMFTPTHTHVHTHKQLTLLHSAPLIFLHVYENFYRFLFKGVIEKLLAAQ